MKKFLYLFVALIFVITAKSQEQDVYYLNEDSKLVKMPLASWIQRNSRFGDYNQGGFVTRIVEMMGKTADTEIALDGTFFFVKSDGSNIKNWKLAEVKQKKDKREMATIKMSLMFGEKSLIKYVPLKYEKVVDDIYVLTPEKPLKKGEYMLFFLNVDGAEWTLHNPHDLSVIGKQFGTIKIPSKNELLEVFYPNTLNSSTVQSQPTYIAQNDEKIIVASDVDSNIPEIDQVLSNNFALIISNENYKYAEDVPFALNDGKTVKKYFIKTLGIPQNNITHLENATLNDIKFAMNRLEEICSIYGNDARLLVYYSGHGVPNEATGDALLLPIDGYATDPTTAIKMGDFYNSLNNLNISQVVLFTDACFSGALRSNQDKMIASARGVVIKPKNTNIPTGNLVVFSAAQGDQTALPYESKSHGLMTYFLLKKLQEGDKNLTLGELSDYIIDNVKKVSVVENRKSQTPNTASALPTEIWRSFKLR